MRDSHDRFSGGNTGTGMTGGNTGTGMTGGNTGMTGGNTGASAAFASLPGSLQKRNLLQMQSRVKYSS